MELTTIEDLIAQLVRAVNRLAIAEERRNELIEAEAEARRVAWESEQAVMAARWAGMVEAFREEPNQ